VTHIEAAINFLKLSDKQSNVIYVFGVYEGENICDILHYADVHEVQIDKLWGFDTFCGLPEEAEGVPKHESLVTGLHDTRCQHGVKYRYGKTVFKKTYINTREARRHILRRINDERVRLEHLKSSTLVSSRVPDWQLEPADLMYINTSLYVTTVLVLDFMFGNNLVKDKCIIAYEKFKSTPKGWDGGEAKAHLKICQKYLVEFEELWYELLNGTEFRRNIGIVLSVGKKIKLL